MSRPGSYIAKRRLGGFLHHLAQLPGELQFLLLRLSHGFDVEHFATLELRVVLEGVGGVVGENAVRVDEIRGITRGEVASASPLDDAELDRIKQALSDISGKDVRLSARVDPSLIGGLVAKVGDKVEIAVNVERKLGFDEAIEFSMTRIVTLFEPLILVIMGLIVAGLLLAVYYPLLTIVSRIA